MICFSIKPCGVWMHTLRIVTAALKSVLTQPFAPTIRASITQCRIMLILILVDFPRPLNHLKSILDDCGRLRCHCSWIMASVPSPCWIVFLGGKWCSVVCLLLCWFLRSFFINKGAPYSVQIYSTGLYNMQRKLCMCDLF